MRTTLKTLIPLSAMMSAFVEEFAKTGNAKQSAITAGYSPKTARKVGPRLLKDPRIKVILAGKPPAVLSAGTYYTREKAIDDYNRALEKSLDLGHTDTARSIINEKVRLYGLVVESKEQEPGGVAVQNNIYSLGSDDELYDLLRRKREAGNGIDPEATGYHVAGLAEAVSQDHRQAIETQVVSS